MKATAMILSLLAVGSLVAASVEGNNTAVVIQKDPVASKTNYQFLCVPVDGLDITGSTTAASVTLSAFLPNDSYPENSVVYPLNSAGAIDTSTAYYSDGTNWHLGSKLGANADDTAIAGGTILWVYVPDARATTTVFCGEDRTVTATARDVLVSNSVTALKNDSSSALPISSLITGTFANDDEILRLQGGQNNYQHIVYDETKAVWKSGSTSTSSADLTIAAGEAFYFLAR